MMCNSHYTSILVRAAHSQRSRRHMLRVNTLFKYVSYHPLEHQIISTGTDRKIGFWEAYDGSLIRELDGSLTDSVNAVDVSEDGVYIVSGGNDKIVKVSATVPF